MKRAEKNWLDDALTKVIGSETREPDFESWSRKYVRQTETLTNKARKQNTVSIGFKNRWSIIMKSTTTKLASIAAIIIIAAFIGLQLTQTPVVSAAEEVFAQAAQAVKNLKSVYIKVNTRTKAHDNFELIEVDYDFVTNELWKRFNGYGSTCWRAEKSGRVVVYDSNSTTLFIKPINHGAKFNGNGGGLVGWLLGLTNIEKVLDNQIESAKKYKWDLQLTHEKDDADNEIMVVIVEAKARGDFTNDYSKNSSISESDNKRIYYFDPETKLLEGLEIYIHTNTGDVLVLEIVDIQYDLPLPESLFTLDLPEDMTWRKELENLDDEYQQMKPEEMARAFFQACADENWDESLKYYPSSKIEQKIKDYLGGLEIINIGEPFKSGRYPGWFVPYEIKLKSGHIKKYNLAVRNDNRAKRYEVDGGF